MSYSARAAREATKEFGHLSGALVGAHNLKVQLERLFDEIRGKTVPLQLPPGPAIPESTEAIAEEIVRLQGRAQILLEIIKELVAIKQALA